ncbi:4Fe-4S ferredoxin iron-sulfur binding domain protein [Ammonifex degensii KC4]|uniref:4Fe-4S ferredoxin iron-sulfur binding domain protein n=1 Tax=Ammonifex degensii (strain DSM 10501 / KC4) TaxID=429009 RepID=C9R952_AMMDK|nr:4Fe-4S binding protein [Ammonifex degensii]ACX52831.1 4Fe-4S ferredoxin iron-sulfur binding domain protein [Ammonifex degensii KC4]
MARAIRVKDPDRCIGCYSCMLACARLVHRSHSLTKSAIRVQTRGGLQSKWGIDVCRACPDAPCAEACPTGALTPRAGGGVIWRRNKCSRCGNCANACVLRVIHFDEEGYPIICLYCGHCARFCPQEVIVWEEIGP